MYEEAKGVRDTWRREAKKRKKLNAKAYNKDLDEYIKELCFNIDDLECNNTPIKPKQKRKMLKMSELTCKQKSDIAKEKEEIEGYKAYRRIYK